MRVPIRLLVACSAGLLVGCGAPARVPPVTAAPPPLAIAPVPAAVPAPTVRLQPPNDPVPALLAKADEEFDAGQRDRDAGRMVAARAHFDAAIDQLLSLPGGARGDSRASAEYDRLLDQISSMDVLALREGDGLTETKSEPAAIDELLGAAMFERPTPALTTAQTVEADLARTAHDLPIPANNRVLSFVELFQGRLHDFMEAGLERSLQYVPMIQATFKQEGVPLDLAYVPLVESAFKPTALSRASARGMWQFMAETGREHGLDQTWFVDERADPEKATLAAAQYLKELANSFDGDWNLALASYNAGPGRIQQAITRAKSSDFWTITASSKYLKTETREYVPMIMAAVLIARNPGLYGFEVGAASPLAYERVTVPDALDLKVIAEWIGVSADDLHALNPELRRTTTPAKEHELKVPIGTADTVQAHLASADPLYAHFNFHTVAKGETIASIAKKYKVTQNDLRQANDLSVRSRIQTNQTLMIPQRSTSALPTAPAPPPAPAVRTAAAKPATPASTASTTYRVQRGDTLYSIAQRFDTTVDLLKRLNKLSTNIIAIGARLTVRQ